MGIWMPPELLDKIVVEASYCPEDRCLTPDWQSSAEDWLFVKKHVSSARRGKPGIFHSHCSISPLLFVSRLWHDAAERCLYRSISINELRNPTCVSKLSRTLHAESRLAEFVRELRLCLKSSTPEAQANLIATCVGLTRLTLVVANRQAWSVTEDVLTKAASSLLGLQSFVFVQQDIYSHIDPTPAICSLVRCVAKWPEIEYAAMYGRADETLDDQITASRSSVPLTARSCPRLRQFYATALQDSHIRDLATIAPSLELLDIFADTSVASHVTAIAESLPRWATTLKTLSIRSPLDDGEIPEYTSDSCFDDGICRQLEGVKNLHVSSHLVPPTTLSCFTNVTRLHYTLERFDDVQPLAGAITSMKSLQSLTINAATLERWSARRDVLQILRPICDAQKVKLTWLPDSRMDDSDGDDYLDDYDYSDDHRDSLRRWHYDDDYRGRSGSQVFFVDGDWYCEDSDSDNGW